MVTESVCVRVRTRNSDAKHSFFTAVFSEALFISDGNSNEDRPVQRYNLDCSAL